MCGIDMAPRLEGTPLFLLFLPLQLNGGVVVATQEIQQLLASDAVLIKWLVQVHLQYLISLLTNTAAERGDMIEKKRELEKQEKD